MIGRLAVVVNVGDMGSSDVWDLDCETVLDGLREALPDVIYDDGSVVERTASVAAAAGSCVVVVEYTHLDEGEFIGEGLPDIGHLFPISDEPEAAERFGSSIAGLPPAVIPSRVSGQAGGFGVGGDRRSLRLAAADVDLIRVVARANPPTAVVIQSGSATVISEWQAEVPAVVQAWYGGCAAGPALADVLLGEIDPSGRMPLSVPNDEGDLPPFDRDATTFRYDRWHGWWHLRRTGRTAAFPFGFGLSYTTFALSDVSADESLQGLRITGTVTNTGKRDGTDVVQAYAELPDPEAPDRFTGFIRVVVPARSRRVFERPGRLSSAHARRRGHNRVSDRFG